MHDEGRPVDAKKASRSRLVIEIRRLEALIEHAFAESSRKGAAVSIWVRPENDDGDLHITSTVTASHDVDTDAMHDAVRAGVRDAVADYLAKGGGQ